jgi:glycosyltransferase involved in cell wall biosynthesis
VSRAHRERLSVLFVTPFLPSPPTFGAQRRLHELVSGVARANDVSVLSLVEPGLDHEQGIRATEEYCRQVVTVPRSSPAAGQARKRLLQLASLGSLHSHQWWDHGEDRLRTSLERMLGRPFDLVQFELAPMARYASTCGLGRRDRPLLCLDEHNIEYDIVRRTARAEADVLRRAFSAVEWRKVRREERHAWRQLDGCIVTSARDRGMLLSDEPATRTSVVPNGVDLEYFRAPDGCDREPSREPHTLIFFGAIDYYPNTDAVLFFLQDVFPRLQMRYPRVRLKIVGRRPPESILARRSADVEVTGVVDDVRPWIEQAGVVVVPLRIGGGTRLKILEAMSMGKPIVSTALGAEGLDVVPERDLLVADDAEGLAVQIGRLLDEPALGARIGASARRVVASRYSWRAAVSSLSAFYGELLEGRAAAR